jgi:peptidoglycan/LPS O-acetylase OafA/YrhL
MTAAWARAIRRGIVPIALGILCWIVSYPAIEDLDPLLKGLGVIMVVLGLVIIVASARRYTADEQRVPVVDETRRGT